MNSASDSYSYLGFYAGILFLLGCGVCRKRSPGMPKSLLREDQMEVAVGITG